MMKILPLNVLTEGYSQFFEEEKIVLSVWLLSAWTFLLVTNWLSTWTLFLLSFFIILGRKILAGGFCCNSNKLNGQTIIVTGATGGIGRETAKELAKRGATVILACRDLVKGEKVVQKIKKVSDSNIILEKLDLSSFESIKKFSSKIIKSYPQIHCLINNAGVMICPYAQTEDGIEMQIGVNYFGHFLLTKLLLPVINKGHPAKIIDVASIAHLHGFIPYDDFTYNNGKSYNRIVAYRNSKLANILHVRHLAKILKGTNVEVFSLHPGVVQSELGRHLPFGIGRITSKVTCLIVKSPKEGAQTSIFCATEARQQEPFYYNDCALSLPCEPALSDEDALKLWQVSEKIVAKF